MKNLKRLTLKYQLLSSYLLSLILTYSCMFILLLGITKGMIFIDPELNLFLNAMSVTTLFSSVIFTVLTLPLIQSFQYDLIPTQAGIWEWTDNYGIKRLVDVCDVSANKDGSWLRVFWAGGYYNISSKMEPLYDGKGKFIKCEWSRNEWDDGIWGERVGDNGSIDESKLFLTIDKH